MDAFTPQTAVSSGPQANMEGDSNAATDSCCSIEAPFFEPEASAKHAVKLFRAAADANCSIEAPLFEPETSAKHTVKIFVHASGFESKETPKQTVVLAMARSRRMKKCAPAVLLWSLGFYVLAVLSLNIVMDRWCPALYEQTYRAKWNGLCKLAAEEPNRPLVVMLGSSRIDDGFQAGQLDGIAGSDGQPVLPYNFGVAAAGPIHENLYLRQMLDRGIRPRLLLVEFLSPLFNDARNRLISEEHWTYCEWVSGWQLAHMLPYMARPSRKRDEWLEARLAPWYVYRTILHGELQQHLITPNAPRPIPWYHDRWGYRHHEVLSPDVYAQLSAAARGYTPTLEKFRLGEGPKRAMRDLLECCRREQISVALVLTPESNVFQSWYSPAAQAALRRLLEELRADFGVEIIDATHWIKDADFADGHHLDTEGARKFSQRMVVEVQRLLH